MTMTDDVTNDPAFEIILASLLADDQHVILVRPRWNRVTGSSDATLFLCRMIACWENNNRKPFAKYDAPCKAADYEPGTSWREELGFKTRYQFDTARALVAVKVSTREEYNNALRSDTLILYWRNDDNQTFYKLNVAALGRMLRRLYASVEFQQSRLSKVDIRSRLYATVESQQSILETTVYSDTDNSKDSVIRYVFSYENTRMLYFPDESSLFPSAHLMMEVAVEQRLTEQLERFADSAEPPRKPRRASKSSDDTPKSVKRKKTASEPSKRDDRIDHAAILAWREVIERFPPRTPAPPEWGEGDYWDAIINTVGDDIARWTDALRAWRGTSDNRFNVNGVLRMYLQRIGRDAPISRRVDSVDRGSADDRLRAEIERRRAASAENN